MRFKADIWARREPFDPPASNPQLLRRRIGNRSRGLQERDKSWSLGRKRTGISLLAPLLGSEQEGACRSLVIDRALPPS